MPFWMYWRQICHIYLWNETTQSNICPRTIPANLILFWSSGIRKECF